LAIKAVRVAPDASFADDEEAAAAILEAVRKRREKAAVKG
jgi:hypothetical protein